MLPVLIEIDGCYLDAMAGEFEIVFKVLGGRRVEEHAFDVLPSYVPALVNEVGKYLIKVCGMKAFNWGAVSIRSSSESVLVVFTVDDEFTVFPSDGDIRFHAGDKLLSVFRIINYIP